MNEPIQPGGIYRGKYRVLKALSSGGTADVYLLHHVVLNREEVLKRARADAGISPEKHQELFANEATILERLGGHFAPRLYDYDGAVPEIYMGRAPGLPLAEYLKTWHSQPQQTPPDVTLLRFAQTLLDALEACHKKNVIVADLKPLNVFVAAGANAGEFDVTLVDFGSSVLKRRSDSASSEDYSPGYGAPELFDRQPAAPAGDVYSFGAILYALFGRREPGLDHAIEDFGERQTLVLPNLQRLILKMTAKDPATRPPIEEIRKGLKRCLADLEEAANPVVVNCPQCHAPIRSRETAHCPACGESLKRKTRVFREESAGGLSAAERMFQAERDGQVAVALYWAKAAWQAGQLSAAARVTALELALQVPDELAFADQLAADLSPDSLPDLARLRFLIACGEYLVRRRRLSTLANYLPWYRDAVRCWPREDRLWVCLALASPPSAREDTLRNGLRQNPTSSRLWRSLGELLCARNVAADGLDAFMNAVHHGERSVSFLILVRTLADELQQQQAPVSGDVVSILTGFLRQHAPADLAEVRQLIEVARKDRDDSRWLLELVETGLKFDPYDAELRAYKARGLFDQRKYEMVVSYLREGALTPATMAVLARAHFELKQWEDAATVLGALLQQHSAALYWFYLVRCLMQLNRHAEARARLREALQRHPQDENLMRLNDRMRHTA